MIKNSRHKFKTHFAGVMLFAFLLRVFMPVMAMAQSSVGADGTYSSVICTSTGFKLIKFSSATGEPVEEENDNNNQAGDLCPVCSLNFHTGFVSIDTEGQVINHPIERVVYPPLRRISSAFMRINSPLGPRAPPAI